MDHQLTEAPKSPRGGGILIFVLAAAGISVSLMQTLVIPIIGQLPDLLNTTAANASWGITATLLTGAVATPMFGRLGDMFGAKRMLIACAVLLTVGSVLAALSTSLLPFVAGRAFQGFGAPVIPLGISVLRAALPADRVSGAMGMVSASLGVGGALGLPLSAVVAENFGWHALFWCAAVLGLISAILFVTLVPDAVPSGAVGRFDILGAIGLAVGLVTLLLPISKGAGWGWTNPLTLGLGAISVLTLLVFAWWQYRAPTPLVDMRTTLRRPVLLTNLSSIAIGFGMMATSLIGPQLLQMPSATGHGLGQSMIAAGLWMAPSGLAMMAASPLASKLIAVRGPKFTLVAGALVIAAGYVVGTQLLTAAAGVLVFTVIVSSGVGMAFAALPTLINAAVPVSETAAANGINSLARSLGTSTSSTVMSAVLAQMSIVVAGHAFPSLDGLRTALLIAAVAAGIGAAIALTIPETTPEPAGEGPVVAPAPLRRRAQHLEYVLAALGRQTAVSMPTSSLPQWFDRGDYLVAAYLGGAGALTIPELARRLDSATEPVSRRITDLIRDGMVSRVPTPDAAAPPQFALTRHGHNQFQRQRGRNVDGLQAILSHWDDGDTAALIGYLGRLSDGIDQERQRQAARDAEHYGSVQSAATRPLQVSSVRRR